MRPYVGTKYSDTSTYPGKMCLRSPESYKSKVRNLVIRCKKRARARLKADLYRLIKNLDIPTGKNKG